MSTEKQSKWEAYKQPVILIACVLVGAVLGIVLGDKAAFLYPIGQIWLNMLFVLLVPLIFFSISSSIAVSSVPGGGAAMETMLISSFGFPSAALPILIMMTQLFDPGCTLVNSCGDTVASMMGSRFLYGKDWYKKTPEQTA